MFRHNIQHKLRSIYTGFSKYVINFELRNTKSKLDDYYNTYNAVSYP
jgi:hypothetical protein